MQSFIGFAFAALVLCFLEGSVNGIPVHHFMNQQETINPSKSDTLSKYFDNVILSLMRNRIRALEHSDEEMEPVLMRTFFGSTGGGIEGASSNADLLRRLNEREFNSTFHPDARFQTVLMPIRTLLAAMNPFPGQESHGQSTQGKLYPSNPTVSESGQVTGGFIKTSNPEIPSSFEKNPGHLYRHFPVEHSEQFIPELFGSEDKHSEYSYPGFSGGQLMQSMPGYLGQQHEDPIPRHLGEFPGHPIDQNLVFRVSGGNQETKQWPSSAGGAIYVGHQHGIPKPEFPGEQLSQPITGFLDEQLGQAIPRLPEGQPGHSIPGSYPGQPSLLGKQPGHSITGSYPGQPGHSISGSYPWQPSHLGGQLGHSIPQSHPEQPIQQSTWFPVPRGDPQGSQQSQLSLGGPMLPGKQQIHLIPVIPKLSEEQSINSQSEEYPEKLASEIQIFQGEHPHSTSTEALEFPGDLPVQSITVVPAFPDEQEGESTSGFAPVYRSVDETEDRMPTYNTPGLVTSENALLQIETGLATPQLYALGEATTGESKLGDSSSGESNQGLQSPNETSPTEATLSEFTLAVEVPEEQPEHFSTQMDSTTAKTAVDDLLAGEAELSELASEPTDNGEVSVSESEASESTPGEYNPGLDAPPVAVQGETTPGETLTKESKLEHKAAEELSGYSSTQIDSPPVEAPIDGISPDDVVLSEFLSGTTTPGEITLEESVPFVSTLGLEATSESTHVESSGSTLGLVMPSESESTASSSTLTIPDEDAVVINDSEPDDSDSTSVIRDVATMTTESEHSELDSRPVIKDEAVVTNGSIPDESNSTPIIPDETVVTSDSETSGSSSTPVISDGEVEVESESEPDESEFGIIETDEEAEDGVTENISPLDSAPIESESELLLQVDSPKGELDLDVSVADESEYIGLSSADSVPMEFQPALF